MFRYKNKEDILIKIFVILCFLPTAAVMPRPGMCPRTPSDRSAPPSPGDEHPGSGGRSGQTPGPAPLYHTV